MHVFADACASIAPNRRPGSMGLVSNTAIDDAIASPAFRFGRTLSYSLVNVYMVRMAGVFMISTSTVAMSTHFAPRWLAALG